MPPPRRRAITLDDGSELDLGDLPEGYAPADLDIDLGGIAGLEAPAPRTTVEAPAGRPPPPTPGVEWAYAAGSGGSTRYRAIPTDSPEGRAVRAAREEYELRGLTAEPFPPSAVAAPPPATTETAIGPITARVREPDGIIASPGRRRGMELLDPAEAEAIIEHGGPAPAVFDDAGRTREMGPAEAAEAAVDADIAARAAMGDVRARDEAVAAREEAYRAGPAAEPNPETFAEGLSRGARSAYDLLADAANAWVAGPRGVRGAPAPDIDFIAGLLGGEDGAEAAGAPGEEMAVAAGPAVPGAPVGRAGRRAGRRTSAGTAPAATDVPPTSAQGGANPMLARALGRNGEALELARRRAESEAGGYADTGRAMRDAEAARVENEDMRRRAMGDARERYRAAMERATSMTLDPEGWYHERGVLGSIGAAIAVAMGSLGSGITGGTNEALGIINASIERDIQAQLTAIDQANSRVAGEANLLDMLAGEFQSRDAAVAAARAAMLEDVANRVATEAAGMNTEEARIAAEEMHDQLITQAREAALAAMRAEQDREIALRLADAQAREAAADARRAEARAAGGSGTGAPSYHEPTEARLNAAARILATANANGRPMTAGDAYAAVGIDPALAGDASRIAPHRSAEDEGVDVSLESSLARLESLVGTEGDIPGIGVIFDQFIPSPVLDVIGSRGAEIREEMMNAADLNLRSRTGATAPTSEEERLSEIAGYTGGSGTEAALRRGLARMRRELEARRTGTIVGDPSEAARFGAGAGVPAED